VLLIAAPPLLFPCSAMWPSHQSFCLSVMQYTARHFLLQILYVSDISESSSDTASTSEGLSFLLLPRSKIDEILVLRGT